MLREGNYGASRSAKESYSQSFMIYEHFYDSTECTVLFWNERNWYWNVFKLDKLMDLSSLLQADDFSPIPVDGNSERGFST